MDLPVQRYPIRKRLRGFKGSGFNVQGYLSFHGSGFCVKRFRVDDFFTPMGYIE
jgi:hypothetical protein